MANILMSAIVSHINTNEIPENILADNGVTMAAELLTKPNILKSCELFVKNNDVNEAILNLNYLVVVYAPTSLLYNEIINGRITQKIKYRTQFEPFEIVFKNISQKLCNVDKKYLNRDITKKICLTIEESCFQYAIQYCQKNNLSTELTKNTTLNNILRARYRHILSMFDCDSNIMHIIENGDLKKIAFANIDEICPIAVDEHKKMLSLRLMQTVTKKACDTFRCTHCGAKNCTYEEKQTRGADEAPSYFCFCLSCNRRFRGG